MIDLKDWCDYVRRHPLKFRFDGLHSRGRSSKSDFFQTVGEAAVADERFMNDYMEKEYESLEADVEEAVKDRRDDNDYLSRFCEYIVHKVKAHQWAEAFPDIPAKRTGWDKVHIDTIMRVVDFYIADLKEDYVRDWLMGDDIQQYWDIIQDKGQEEYLLKDHEPIAVWNHAGDYEIALKDVFFVCPSCHGEPQTEEDLTDLYGLRNGYPHFYCGSCGAEANLGRRENILDFFLAMDIQPYPFNKEKQAIWAELLKARKALGENKLDIKVGDLVHLEACEDRYSGDEKWISYLREPGELVKCTWICEKSMSFEYPDGSGHGGITWDHVWSKAEPAQVT